MAKGITWPDAVETRHFANFPGIYGPGVVVPLTSTGLTEKEAVERIHAGNLPLAIIDDAPPKAEKGGEK